MYMLVSACEDADVLRIIYFGKILLEIVFVAVPIALIVMLMVDMAKVVIANDEEKMTKMRNLAIRRIITAMGVFSVPSLAGIIVGVVDQATGYMSCLTNANADSILVYQAQKDKKKAQEEAEWNQEIESAADKALQEAIKELDAKRAQAKRLAEISKSNGTTEMIGATTSDNYQNGVGSLDTNKGEPDPVRALTYWYQKDTSSNERFNPANFSVMSDKNSGMSLGAWPKNANLNNLSGNVKTYQNGTLIFPTTGDGSVSYDHNGIDIVGPIGTPIYAPCDGTYRYSEWGHTLNRAATETAYTVSITMDEPFSYTGQWANGVTQSSTTRTGKVEILFLTHMVGIKNRITSSGTKVKKGELIGFMGTAGNEEHLHMTFYDGNSKWGLYTPEIRKIYEITGSKKAGE